MLVSSSDTGKFKFKNFERLENAFEFAEKVSEVSVLEL
jgi:hypothetical protein